MIRLVKLDSFENADVIADYLIAYKNETDTKVSTRTTICLNIIRFAQKMGKPLGTVTQDDILFYFNGLKKSEDIDPKHKWKGSWNMLRIIIPRFFKWYYYPNLRPDKKHKPDIIPYLPRMKRMEKTYKPSDMWTIEDNELFLKYCPATATDARPHEILGLKIEDIIWPVDGGNPSFTVIGKTGQRSLRIFRFQSYVKDLIEQHPMRAITSSYLIWSKKTKGKLGVRPFARIYSDLKAYFSRICDKAISQDDRLAILHLLKKPWNPYVFRQTVATEYLGSGALTNSQGDQWFGWSERSNTAVSYQNYLGDEASNSLGVYFGVAQRQPPKAPKQRYCPNINCQELNNPEAPFCKKCRIPLSVAGHLEREQEILELKVYMMQAFESYHGLAKERMNKMDNSIRFLTGEITKYRGQFGPRPLTEKERNKVEESLEEIRALPPESEYILTMTSSLTITIL